MDRAADRFVACGRSVAATVGRSTVWADAWRGPDADAFRAQIGAHRAALEHVAAELSRMGGVLRANAADQRTCSATNGPTGPAANPMWFRADPRPHGAATAAQDRDIRARAQRLLDDPSTPPTVRARLRRLLDDPHRSFIQLDPFGDGRLIDVHGDLTLAQSVVIVVPGFATTIDSMLGRNGREARLHRAMTRDGSNAAVIGFLGYDAPDWSANEVASVVGENRAAAGAESLTGLVDRLHRDGFRSDQITIVGHSYGSTVTGLALRDYRLAVGRVVVVGSPGLGEGIESVDDLRRPDVEIWAAAADGDRVPLAPLHGANPADPSFGAHVFAPTAAHGHSSYFDGAALDQLARLAAGRRP